MKINITGDMNLSPCVCGEVPKSLTISPSPSLFPPSYPDRVLDVYSDCCNKGKVSFTYYDYTENEYISAIVPEAWNGGMMRLKTDMNELNAIINDPDKTLVRMRELEDRLDNQVYENKALLEHLQMLADKSEWVKEISPRKTILYYRAIMLTDITAIINSYAQKDA